MGSHLATQTRTDSPRRALAPTSDRRIRTVASLLAPGNYRRICAKAGVSPQHVARTIKGMKGASFHVAARIAEAAGVSLDELYAYISASPLLKVKGRRTVGDDTNTTNAQ